MPELGAFGPSTTVSSGLDPLQRGNIVHRVCEHLHTDPDPNQLLDWAIAMEGITVSQSERQELEEIVDRYLNSDYFQESQRMKVDHEVEFAVP